MFNQTNLKRPAASFAAVIGLSLVLSACGGGGGGITPTPDPKPDPTPTEQAGLIMGKVTPGQATSLQPDELPTTALVSAQGQFDLNLPNFAQMTGTYASTLFNAKDVFGCSDDEIQTYTAPAGLKITPVNFLKNETSQRFIAPVNQAATTYNFKAWWFSNMDATVVFKANCLVASKIDTTLNLKRGWNVLNTDFDFGKSTTYAVTSQPTTYIPWVKANAAASLSTQALAANVLEPWKNLPQYRNR
ncbi:hypothetical protein [Deinococcus arenicola]|uniref:Lipoprotein n=1 Tax=Deinococcus arenicola TaxID=2994950 RepID=A0ABU4DLU5_9DEIO|nr:hypothetical protein [Deinococcus sp. ZS9-10]MDV6373392.1 hypothetical protein [Deinococcus sp. ZS9-10]